MKIIMCRAIEKRATVMTNVLHRFIGVNEIHEAINVDGENAVMIKVMVDMVREPRLLGAQLMMKMDARPTPSLLSTSQNGRFNTG